MLEIADVEVAYGDATALWGVSLSIAEGELVSVVGPNGAGKTTLINSICRLLPLRGGRLSIDGRDISKLAPYELYRHGISLVPEGRHLFSSMTVEENLEIGSYRVSAKHRRAQTLQSVYEMFPILRERRSQLAGQLSGGQQQMVAIGRALMAGPRLLLLDEPSLGLAPTIVNDMFDAIRAVHSAGVAVLLVEQNVDKALAIADRAYVIEGGRIVSEGIPSQLADEPHVREAYLGLRPAV